MKPFYVIREEYGKFIPYDIMPYLINCYKTEDKRKWKYNKKPETFDEYKSFIKKKSIYMWWAKCEYEIVLYDWPCLTNNEKWDVHKQVMMNIDLITEVFIENIEKKSK